MELDYIEDTNIELDNSWIDSFEESEKVFSSFYKEDVENIKLYFFYVNVNNELENIHEDNLILSNNKIEKEKLIRIIKSNKIKNSIAYSFLSILKYNFSLSPEDLPHFMDEKITDSYLNQANYLEDILFEPTITLFQDLNCLIFIFKEKSKNKKLIQQDKQMSTKKVPHFNSRRKTRKTT
jgi:hypothetical protein